MKSRLLDFMLDWTIRLETLFFGKLPERILELIVLVACISDQMLAVKYGE